MREKTFGPGRPIRTTLSRGDAVQTRNPLALCGNDLPVKWGKHLIFLSRKIWFHCGIAKNDHSPKNYAFLAPVIAQISRFRRVLTSYLNRNMQHLTTFKPAFASLAMICSLQLASAQTITTNMMAPPGFVNMNVPGMKLYIVHGHYVLPMDHVHRPDA